jgi:hypothetical protein
MIVKQIEQLLSDREDLKDLCGEMLATISLAANQVHKISELGELATKWQKRFANYISVTTNSGASVEAKEGL